MICSAMGRLRIGTIGLGKSQVRGRNRVPDPPAINTARIRSPFYWIFSFNLTFSFADEN